MINGTAKHSYRYVSNAQTRRKLRFKGWIIIYTHVVYLFTPLHFPGWHLHSKHRIKKKIRKKTSFYQMYVLHAVTWYKCIHGKFYGSAKSNEKVVHRIVYHYQMGLFFRDDLLLNFHLILHADFRVPCWKKTHTHTRAQLIDVCMCCLQFYFTYTILTATFSLRQLWQCL